MSDVELLRKAITWVNETFVPLGLKPIEYFQPACPGQHQHCVIAEVLKVNPKWGNVSVNGSNIELGLDEYLEPTFNYSDYNFEVPTEVHNFILAFDDCQYPELVDLDELDEHYNDYHEYRVEILTKLQKAGVDIGDRLEEIETTNVIVKDGVDVTNV